MTTMTREAIFDTIKSILVDSLAADEDDVTMTSRLTTDLGAESIDFLDIAFQLERAFGFSNIQKELLPEGAPSDPTYVKDGRLTPQGVAALKARLPHVDFSNFEKDPQITKIAECFTVESLVAFVERKLAARA
jgi:acyl carrier protein